MKNISKRKPKLLLHICCVGCGVYINQVLEKDFEVIFYFYNPNIYPENEYKKRLEETKKIARDYKTELLIGDYGHGVWLEKITGYEKEKERGKRCEICYKDRLETTAKKAKEIRVEFFTTTLSISPHKDFLMISNTGNEVAERYGLNFLDKDFKKQNGYKKSVELSQKLGLYRQNYCGCEFSMRK